MKILGLTGQSGAGKTLFSQMLQEKGYPCINADELYHSMLVPPSKTLDAIKNVFGAKFFLEDGSLDRKKLAKHVFSSQENLKLLNETVLPEVTNKLTEIAKDYENAGAELLIIDAPTLFEAGYDKSCDLTVSVIAPNKTRIERIAKRDNISFEDALLRTNAQKDDSFYYERSDYVIENSGDPIALKRKAEKLICAIGIYAKKD